MGISTRGTKAKTITSCDNAFVTNILLPRDPAAQRMFSVRKRSANVAAATMFYLCESEATATMFYLCESEATATKRPAGTEINPTFLFHRNLYRSIWCTI
ncbi:hypothetical protein ACQKNB_14275 [Lysinibacillus xylanilyticus]|uniref:hypothetical protein n=1 Tax=Lysinibacillus xylanilyticus TaxID=582475 RepID=UPI003D08AB93